jgi:hypothetical protein
VVRAAHRTCVARALALCLVLLAVSPVTAPFTTCDLTDFAQSQPTDTSHHPGRQLAEAHVKAAPHLITIAFELTPGLSLHADEQGQSIVELGAAPHTRRHLRSVLRL